MDAHEPNTSPASEVPEPIPPELQDGFYGFVDSEPLRTEHDGVVRLFFWAAQEHYDYTPEGARIKLPTTHHPIVAFRGAAEYGKRKLAKNDWFLAHGKLEEGTNPNTGRTEFRFVVSRFGHDGARMNYEVGNPRRLVDMKPAQREQTRSAAFQAPEHEQPAHELHARAL